MITKYFNSKTKEVNYKNIDNILYNQYIVSLYRPRAPGQEYEKNIGKYRNKIDNKVK